MSLQEFYVHGGQRETLDELKHTGREIEGAAPSYDLIQVYTREKTLGSGSTGTVYHARMFYDHSPHRFRDVVVKFPNTLLQSGHIKIKTNGYLHITKPHDTRLFKEALEDLETEWHNGFVLRYGPSMMTTGLADPKGVKINEASLPWQETHPLGFFNIHELLAMESNVPCLISAHFETALLLWARANNPHSSIIFEHVIPQIRNALYYMHHTAHLAHMDIKPYNMLCTRTRDGLHVVLCDFGATCSISDLGESPAGTIGYMAPEVEQRDVPSHQYQKGYNPMFADAFSYAVSMLHLLCPHVPCETVADQPVMLERILASTKQNHLTNIVHEKDPSRRYALFSY